LNISSSNRYHSYKIYCIDNFSIKMGSFRKFDLFLFQKIPFKVYFRFVPNKFEVEILAYSNKAKQTTMTKRMERLYDN